MIGRRCKRGALPGVLAVMLLALTGCEGDSNPYGVPYSELGYDLAGIYNATSPEANLDLRIVLGLRHYVTGSYVDPSGALIRFSGSWERSGGRLVVSLPDQPGMPAEIVFDVSRETILTEIPRGPFSTTPETAPPSFFEQDIMRLRAAAIVTGVQLELDLVRVITDVVSGGGGGAQT